MSDPLLERVRGALGQDFEIIARGVALDRLVASQVLDPELGASPMFPSRFQRGAETAAAIGESRGDTAGGAGSEGGLVGGR